MKALHFHKITGQSLHWGKVIHTALNKTLFTFIVTSIFTSDEQNEKIDEKIHKVEAPLLMEIVVREKCENSLPHSFSQNSN